MSAAPEPSFAPQPGTPVGPQPVPAPSRGRAALRVVGAVVLGIVVGIIGTVMFQAVRPWGVVLALAATLAGSVTCRAWAGWGTLTGYAVGWLLGTGVLAFVEGPGGDVLVPAATLSTVWLVGGVVAVVLPSFLPWRWFSDTPAPPRPKGPTSPVS